MQIGAVIQARMSSQRLPGKVLMPLAGKPLVQYLLESLEHSAQLGGVVVATSDQPSDAALAHFCREQEVACYRGSLDDVTARLLGAAEWHSFEAIVRVCADSPLLDWRLVDQAVELFFARHF